MFTYTTTIALGTFGSVSSGSSEGSSATPTSTANYLEQSYSSRGDVTMGAAHEEKILQFFSSRSSTNASTTIHENYASTTHLKLLRNALAAGGGWSASLYTTHTDNVGGTSYTSSTTSTSPLDGSGTTMAYNTATKTYTTRIFKGYTTTGTFTDYASTIASTTLAGTVAVTTTANHVITAGTWTKYGFFTDTRTRAAFPASTIQLHDGTFPVTGYRTTALAASGENNESILSIVDSAATASIGYLDTSLLSWAASATFGDGVKTSIRTYQTDYAGTYTYTRTTQRSLTIERTVGVAMTTRTYGRAIFAGDRMQLVSSTQIVYQSTKQNSAVLTCVDTTTWTYTRNGAHGLILVYTSGYASDAIPQLRFSYFDGSLVTHTLNYSQTTALEYQEIEDVFVGGTSSLSNTLGSSSRAVGWTYVDTAKAFAAHAAGASANLRPDFHRISKGDGIKHPASIDTSAPVYDALYAGTDPMPAPHDRTASISLAGGVTPMINGSLAVGTNTTASHQMSYDPVASLVYETLGTASYAYSITPGNTYQPMERLSYLAGRDLYGGRATYGPNTANASHVDIFDARDARLAYQFTKRDSTGGETVETIDLQAALDTTLDPTLQYVIEPRFRYRRAPYNTHVAVDTPR